MGILSEIAFGFCWWDIPGLILLIAVTAVVIVKQRQLNAKKKDLEAGMRK